MPSTTKQDLAEVVREILEIPKHRHPRMGLHYKIVTTIVKAMTKALLRGETIKIDGFGILKVITKPPTRSPCYYYPYLNRKGLHWEVKDIPAKTVVVFSPSKPLKRMINE